MKGKKHSESPKKGVIMADPAPSDVYAGGSSNVVKEARKRKRGGKVKEVGHVEGKKSKMRLDRPGRKTGGRVGADKSPLSTAARVTEADDHETEDCD